MLTAGIDIGHESVTVVLVDDSGTVGHATLVIAGEVGAAAERAFAQTLGELRISRDRVAHVFATGIGRELVGLADGHRTAMLSHVRGAHALCPTARTVIDMGAEGSRILRCDAEGRLTDFALNDKCAAGAGVFLETVADMLEVPVAELGAVALAASHAVVLTATCAVFAESEIVAEIHRGTPRAAILRGVHASLAARVAAASRRVGIAPDVVLTGGVARNAGVVQALGAELGVVPVVPEHPEIAGALGAALLAREGVGATA